MKRLILSAICLLGFSSAASADQGDYIFGVANFYLFPTQSVDLLGAVATVVWSEDVDDLYSIPINDLNFTSTNTDDQSDPLPLEQIMSAH